MTGILPVATAAAATAGSPTRIPPPPSAASSSSTTRGATGRRHERRARRQRKCQAKGNALGHRLDDSVGAFPPVFELAPPTPRRSNADPDHEERVHEYVQRDPRIVAQCAPRLREGGRPDGQVPRRKYVQSARDDVG